MPTSPAPWRWLPAGGDGRLEAPAVMERPTASPSSRPPTPKPRNFMRNRVFVATLLLSAVAMSPPVASFLSSAVAAAPATPNADAIAARVQAFYDQTKTFQASF